MVSVVLRPGPGFAAFDEVVRDIGPFVRLPSAYILIQTIVLLIIGTLAFTKVERLYESPARLGRRVALDVRSARAAGVAGGQDAGG
jgi:hypothetical protein